jgi:hypothetical protein
MEFGCRVLTKIHEGYDVDMGEYRASPSPSLLHLRITWLTKHCLPVCVHNIGHLSRQVKDFGPISGYHRYPLESHLGNLQGMNLMIAPYILNIIFFVLRTHWNGICLQKRTMIFKVCPWNKHAIEALQGHNSLPVHSSLFFFHLLWQT